MNTRMTLQSRSEHSINPNFAFNNPNYGSLDDLRQDILKPASHQATPLLSSRPNVLSATAQLESIQRLLKMKKPSLPPSQSNTPRTGGGKQLPPPPPHRPPPPPPRTPPRLPPRLHRKQQPHIYENMPIVNGGHYYNSDAAQGFISNVSSASSSSSASSNATVIVRKSPNHLSSTIINETSMNDLIDECLVQIESDPMFQFTPRMLSSNSLEKTIRAAANSVSNAATNGHSNKKVLSLSPIMTSSRSDLKPPTSDLKKSLFSERQSIKQRRPLHQTTDVQSSQRAHMVNNFNYFLQEDLKTIRRPLSPQDNTGSINSLLLLQPPSPFKSDEDESSFEDYNIQVKNTFNGVNSVENKLNSIHSILSSNRKPSSNKRVSFMLNDHEIEMCPEPLMALEEIVQSDSISPKADNSDIECNSSSVSSESASISIPSPTQDDEDADFDERPSGNLSHLSPSKHMLCCTSPPCLKQIEDDARHPAQQRLRHDQLDLFKERFFAKIFSNDGYFLSGGKEAGIESASATSIQSSCSSSSSTSSGYKSNQSNSLHMMSGCSNKLPAASELDCFIESNWDRLARLKVKRSQLVSTIISQADIIEINRANNGNIDENGSTIDSLGSNGSNCSRISEQEDSYDESSSCHVISNASNKHTEGHNSSGNSSLDTMIIKTESARMYHKFFEHSPRMQADCQVTTRRAVF